MQYPPLSEPQVSPYEMPNSLMKTELIKDEKAGPVEKRQPTNVGFLWAFGVAVFIWFLLCFYCMYHGDLSRIEIELSPNASTVLKDLAYNVKISCGEIYLSCTAAVAFSALLIVLFRRYAGAIVWFVVGLVLTALVLGTALSWYAYSMATADDTKTTSYTTESSFYTQETRPTSNGDAGIVAPVVFTTVAAVVSLLIFVARKHIRMVIRLFKEGGKVAESMPLILAQPFVTFVLLAVTLTLSVYFALWIITAGELKKDEDGHFYIKKDGLMMFSIFYHLFVVWWMVHFLIGCQHMVIAGATATWYFTRDKIRVENAIMKSYKFTFKYHLGSVALGSLILTAVQFIRSFIRATIRKNRNFIGYLLAWMFKYIEKFIAFLTKNAYIEIAIYGDGFFVSGKRAFRVLTNNVINVTLINSVGDFVMVLGRFLVTGLAVLIGYLLLQGKSDITQIGYPLGVIGIVSFVIVHAFMLAFEMIVDSIFICFCEDCDINDGTQRPYYMSKEMMVFINEDHDPNKTLRVGDHAAE